MPAGAEPFTTETADGVTLRGARWPSAVSRHRGTVCLLHGRAEFIELYFEVIHDLQARGFEVATIDWRGQGGSQRLLKNPRRGHVDDFFDYEKDLQALIGFAEENCRPPFFALAHSTGAAVLLRATHKLKGRIKRMVLTAPLIAFGTIPIRASLIGPLSGFLNNLGFGDFFVPGGDGEHLFNTPFDENVITSDPDRYRRASVVLDARPELAIGWPTIGWLSAASRTMRLFARPEFPVTVGVPSVIVTAGADEVVSVRAQEELALCLRAGGNVFVAGAKHHLMLERDVFRNQFWAVFDAFIPGSEADREARTKAMSGSAA